MTLFLSLVGVAIGYCITSLFFLALFRAFVSHDRAKIHRAEQLLFGVHYVYYPAYGYGWRLAWLPYWVLFRSRKGAVALKPSECVNCTVENTY